MTVLSSGRDIDKPEVFEYDGGIGRTAMSYRVTIAIIIILVLLITAVYINFFVIPDKPDSKKSPLIPGEIPIENPSESLEKKEPAASPGELPPLSQSDDLMRINLKNFSGQPVFQKWLSHPDIIRRLVAITDAIARGEIPPPALTYLHPEDPFKVVKKDNQIIADPENYSRHNSLISLFVSIDTGGIKVFYDRIYPLLEEAYSELGYPEKRFEDTLIQAFEVILNTPVVRSPVFLEQRVLSYSFLDPRLENLLPVQKMMVRMGPGNTLRIQKKCREIVSRLNPENQ